MPPFGSRRKSAPETVSPDPTPEPAAPSAVERLQLLLSEQSEIRETLDLHREKRAVLLREDDEFDAIRALASEDAELRLRLEQIALRLPDIERELEQERREEFEAAWQSHRPGLAEAEAELTEATRTFLAALERANTVYGRAQHFGERLREFVRPPPTGIFNEWSLREYLKAVALRQPPAVAMALVELTVDDAALFAPAERFAPRRVPYQLVEQVSPIAPMRRVRMLHTIRASNLNIGHARLKAGEEMELPARAAFVLTYSGCGEYTDAAETTAAA
jgi:hypothetical protein